MKSKTLRLISQYQRELREQAEDPNAMPPEGGEMPMEDPNAAAAPPEEPPQEPEVLQVTSDLENKYISTIIDAALFEPSLVTPEQENSLLALQQEMRNKDMAGKMNAREKVLPVIEAIIYPERDKKGIKELLRKAEE